jgi:tetratricopeptide (TPR) repeat protein
MIKISLTKISRIKVILIIALASACSSNPQIKIQSAPEGALVTSRTADGSIKSIGKTPLQVASREIGGAERLSGLIVTKEGYEDHHILLGRDRGQESYDINIRLSTKTEDPKVLDAKSRQEKLARMMVQAYNFITSKRYEEAKSLLTNAVQEYPHISVGYDLLGTLSYLQKDLRSALNYYERSFVINPENNETKQMIDRLKGMLQ